MEAQNRRLHKRQVVRVSVAPLSVGLMSVALALVARALVLVSVGLALVTSRHTPDTRIQTSIDISASTVACPWHTKLCNPGWE